MFNILEHSKDKLAPVIAYIKAVMNSHFHAYVFISLLISIKKMQLVMLLRNQKFYDLKTVL